MPIKAGTTFLEVEVIDFYDELCCRKVSRI
jgi:hypothetical protein